MPNPITTFFRPESIMKNNKCKTLLKGNLLYDYASPTITWSVTGGSFTSSAITQSESWTYFIPRSISMSTTSQFTRSSNFGTSKTFTVMFRFYVSSLSNPGTTGTTVIGNGTPGGMGASFWVVTMNGPNSTAATQQTFRFLYTRSASLQAPLNIGPATYIVAGKWYHIAVVVVDTGSQNSIYGYVDGLNTATLLNVNYIDTAVGNTRLGNIGMGQAQGFELAEFVFLEKALTSEEIAAYATSPYI